MLETIRREGPDYDNCLVNLSNSILKKFGAPAHAATQPMADECLAGDYRNVVLLVLDAMGTSIVEKHLAEDGFFRSHLKGSFSSVYPPTTVAATTSLLSGLYPNEHGWLGWDMYFPKLDKNVSIFANSDQLKEKEGAGPDLSGDGKWDTDSLIKPEPAADFHVGFTYLPYQNIVEQINGVGGRAFAAIPFLPPFPDSLEKILAHTKELCEKPERKFIYAYWSEPDSTMHSKGTVCEETHKLVVSIEEQVKAFAEGLSDTLLLITADHSHMDSRNLCILDYPEVLECLKRMPSIEPRTLNLYVRDECRGEFPAIFKEAFGEDFLLLTREQVLREKLFGTGEDREDLGELIGDYVALAVSDVSLFNTHYEAQVTPGGHAGLTAEEGEIPFIVVGA